MSTGALVISLDFELTWGSRDHVYSRPDHTENVLGARTVIPRLLEIFEEFGVSATWATVGFLFAASRDELEHLSPVARPTYIDPRLSPYGTPIGANEEQDPAHFAPSLIRRIQRTPRQEIATHTFSHYYCGEQGQTGDTFRADLSAARSIASRYGIELRSIVFPRNQHNREYDDILLEAGIRAYRGNPRSWMWRFADAEESGRRWKRTGRGIDAYLGIAGSGSLDWRDVLQPSGLSDVCASCFLRPYRRSLRYLEPLRFRRIRHGLRDAARIGRIFHLWWHPHNFGVQQEENLRFLRRVLTEFAACRERYGMRSLTMAEVDQSVRAETEASATAFADADANGRADRRSFA